jgi:hypothetical protein
LDDFISNENRKEQTKGKIAAGISYAPITEGGA